MTYSCHNREKFTQHIQMQLSKKPKTLSQIFFAFLKSSSDFKHCGKNDEPHSLNVFDITDSERGGYLIAERSCFRTVFGSQRVSGRKRLPLFIWLFHDFGINLKTSLLVNNEILGLFINNLIADEIYSRHTRENFGQPIQMQLFKKSETFSGIFIAFLKSSSNFEHFETKRWASSLKYLQKLLTPNDFVS